MYLIKVARCSSSLRMRLLTNPVGHKLSPFNKKSTIRLFSNLGNDGSPQSGNDWTNSLLSSYQQAIDGKDVTTFTRTLNSQVTFDRVNHINSELCGFVEQFLEAHERQQIPASLWIYDLSVLGFKLKSPAENRIIMELYKLIGDKESLVQNPLELIRCLKGLALTDLQWGDVKVKSTFKKSLMDKISVVVGTLPKEEVRSLLMSLGRMRVPWTALPLSAQKLLWSNLDVHASLFTMRQSVNVVHSLAMMQLPLSAADEAQRAIITRIITRTLTSLMDELKRVGPGPTTTGDIFWMLSAVGRLRCSLHNYRPETQQAVLRAYHAAKGDLNDEDMAIVHKLLSQVTEMDSFRLRSQILPTLVVASPEMVLTKPLENNKSKHSAHQSTSSEFDQMVASVAAISAAAKSQPALPKKSVGTCSPLSELLSNAKPVLVEAVGTLHAPPSSGQAKSSKQSLVLQLKSAEPTKNFRYNQKLPEFGETLPNALQMISAALKVRMADPKFDSLFRYMGDTRLLWSFLDAETQHTLLQMLPRRIEQQNQHKFKLKTLLSLSHMQFPLDVRNESHGWVVRTIAEVFEQLNVDLGDPNHATAVDNLSFGLTALGGLRAPLSSYPESVQRHILSAFSAAKDRMGPRSIGVRSMLSLVTDADDFMLHGRISDVHNIVAAPSTSVAVKKIKKAKTKPVSPVVATKKQSVSNASSISSVESTDINREVVVDPLQQHISVIAATTAFAKNARLNGLKSIDVDKTPISAVSLSQRTQLVRNNNKNSDVKSDVMVSVNGGGINFPSVDQVPLVAASHMEKPHRKIKTPKIDASDINVAVVRLRGQARSLRWTAPETSDSVKARVLETLAVVAGQLKASAEQKVNLVTAVHSLAAMGLPWTELPADVQQAFLGSFRDQSEQLFVREEVQLLSDLAAMGLTVRDLSEDQQHWLGSRQALLEKKLRFSTKINENSATLFEDRAEHLAKVKAAFNVISPSSLVKKASTSTPSTKLRQQNRELQTALSPAEMDPLQQHIAMIAATTASAAAIAAYRETARQNSLKLREQQTTASLLVASPSTQSLSAKRVAAVSAQSLVSTADAPASSSLANSADSSSATNRINAFNRLKTLKTMVYMRSSERTAAMTSEAHSIISSIAGDLTRKELLAVFSYAKNLWLLWADMAPGTQQALLSSIRVHSADLSIQEEIKLLDSLASISMFVRNLLKDSRKWYYTRVAAVLNGLIDETASPEKWRKILRVLKTMSRLDSNMSNYLPDAQSAAVNAFRCAKEHWTPAEVASLEKHESIFLFLTHKGASSATAPATLPAGAAVLAEIQSKGREVDTINKTPGSKSVGAKLTKPVLLQIQSKTPKMPKPQKTNASVGPAGSKKKKQMVVLEGADEDEYASLVGLSLAETRRLVAEFKAHNELSEEAKAVAALSVAAPKAPAVAVSMSMSMSTDSVTGVSAVSEKLSNEKKGKESVAAVSMDATKESVTEPLVLAEAFSQPAAAVLKVARPLPESAESTSQASASVARVADTMSTSLYAVAEVPHLPQQRRESKDFAATDTFAKPAKKAKKKQEQQEQTEETYVEPQAAAAHSEVDVSVHVPSLETLELEQQQKQQVASAASPSNKFARWLALNKLVYVPSSLQTSAGVTNASGEIAVGTTKKKKKVKVGDS